MEFAGRPQKMITSDQYAEMQLRLRNEAQNRSGLRSGESKQDTETTLGSCTPRETKSVVRPLVRFDLRRVRLLDRDNAWGSIKSLLDGLTTAGLIPGDAEDQIDIDVRQQKVSRKNAEQTVIEIDYAPTEKIHGDS
jgi:hypothetical protein